MFLLLQVMLTEIDVFFEYIFFFFLHIYVVLYVLMFFNRFVNVNVTFPSGELVTVNVSPELYGHFISSGFLFSFFTIYVYKYFFLKSLQNLKMPFCIIMILIPSCNVSAWMVLNNQIYLTKFDMCCLHFQNRSCYKQLAKQLIVQGAMEQDTENETENEELPVFFSFKIHTS